MKINLPVELKILCFEQYKRDLNFRMWRYTAYCRPKIPENMIDLWNYRNRNYQVDVEECLDAINDLDWAMFDSKHAVCKFAGCPSHSRPNDDYLVSVDFFNRRINYLDKCKFASRKFLNRLSNTISRRQQRATIEAMNRMLI